MGNDSMINDDQQQSGQNRAVIEQSSLFSPSRHKGLYSDRRGFVISRKIIAGVLGFTAFVTLVIFLSYIIPAMQELLVRDGNSIIDSGEIRESEDYKKQISQLKRDIQHLSARYKGLSTSQSYLVINTTYNLFHLYRNKKLIREGHCSSGSYKMLKTEEGRSWIFKTPKGKFWVQGKMTNPAWKRPDWAFVEEGLPIPPLNDPSRYEYGVLGEYAMALGDGYLIHGTLYKRFLGMPVTHGCVRLNDEDIEAIFHTLTIGSIVYIF